MISQRYTIVDTSFGKLYITVSNNHIDHITTVKPSAFAALRADDLPVLKAASTAIRRYLSGEIQHLDLPVNDRFSPFQKAVFTHIAAIPYGTVQSSQTVADHVGRANAVRAVEMLCKTNPLLIVVPVHRIEFRDGCISPTTRALRKLEERNRNSKPKLLTKY